MRHSTPSPAPTVRRSGNWPRMDSGAVIRMITRTVMGLTKRARTDLITTARSRDSLASAGAAGALQADGVVVAVISGRRLFVFGRPRMGSRSRRRQGRRNAAALASGHDRRWGRILRRGILRARPPGGLPK